LSRRPDSGLEPSLGDLDGLEPATRSRTHLRAGSRTPSRLSEPAPKPRRKLPWLLLLLAAFAAAAWFSQDRLRALLPEPAQTAQLAEAEAALVAGRLAGEPDAALERFQAVLAGEPDSERARAGIKGVGTALLLRSRAAINAGDLAGARADFELAQRILLGGDEIDALSIELDAAEKRQVELEPMLTQAMAAARAGRLSGSSNSAAELYLRALRSDPTNGLAKRGLEDVAAALGTRAGAAIEAGNPRAAERAMVEINRIQPEWPGLPELRARMANSRPAQTTTAAEPPPAPAPPDPAPATETATQNTPRVPAAQIAELLDAAEALLAAGRVDAPDDPNARAVFERVLALDPGNTRARRGLARVGSGYLLKARMAIEAQDYDAAAARLTDAERAGADPDEVTEVALLLREIDEAGSTLPTAEADPGIDRGRLQELNARGQRALSAGDLVDPPGDSALDLFRAALAIDGNDASARAGLAAIAPRANALFEDAMSMSRLAAAERQLDAFRAAGGSASTEAAMRRMLADGWLAEAERRVMDGRIEAAERAVSRARAADPAAPGLLEAESRLGLSQGPSS
jgi:tetratricopeptide (TPR) repeat protein